MADLNDQNARVIAEFRANGGEVGGPFDGAPILLLHHVGATTARSRSTSNRRTERLASVTSGAVPLEPEQET